MALVSYAQNFEDVMLWRALKHVPSGFYVDIGAHDPTVDSVSRLFYEQGWRGLHAEPLAGYCNDLRIDRPDEVVVQAAVSNNEGLIPFFEIPETGISTADAQIAQEHHQRGFTVINELTVPAVELHHIFDQIGNRDIHWMKVDVEGFEKQVIESWRQHPARPWIVVVESTLPLTQISSHESWEFDLLSRGYLFAYFDGLNRFYVHETQCQLLANFKVPPNVFDGFTLSGKASHSFCVHLNETAKITKQKSDSELTKLKEQYEQTIVLHQEAFENTEAIHREQEHALRLEYADREDALRDQLQAEQQKLSLLEQEYLLREKELTEHNAQTREELETLLRAQVQREQAVATQLLALGQEYEKEKKELASAYNDREQALKLEHAELQDALRLELEARQQRLSRLEQERVLREKLHAEHTLQFREELEGLLHIQLQREQDVAAQLQTLHQQSEQEKARQASAYSERERALQLEQAEREGALHEQLQAEQQKLSLLEQEHLKQAKELTEHNAQTRLELETLLRAQVQREQAVATQLLALGQQFEKKKSELISAYSERESSLRLEHAKREDAIREQLKTGQQRFILFEQEYLQREKTLTVLNAQTHQELETLLRAQVQREQAVAEEILALQQQTTQTLAQQSSEFLSRQEALYDAWKDEKNTLQKRLTESVNELQALRHANEIQLHKNAFVVEKYVSERQALIEAKEDLKRKLHLEIIAGQQANVELHKKLVEIQRNLAKTHASLSWRLTSPLRRIWDFITGATPDALLHESSAQGKILLTSGSTANSVASISSQIKQDEIAQEHRANSEKEISSLDTTCTTAKTEVFSEINLTEQTMTPILQVQDLLKLSGEQLIRATYATLLSREPDTAGFAHFLTRLQQGYGRQRVIAEIANSEEAKKKGVDLPGLKEVLREHSSRRSWWRALISMPTRHEQSLNRIEELLTNLYENSQKMEMRLEARLNKIEAATMARPSCDAPETNAQAPHAEEFTQQQVNVNLGQQSQLWLKRIQTFQGRK